MLCFFRIQLILLLMTCWDVTVAVPVGFLFSGFNPKICHTACLISLWLFPFCLMACLSFCSFPIPPTRGLPLHIACEPVGLVWLVQHFYELGGAWTWRGWEVHNCNFPIYCVPCCSIQIYGYQYVQKGQGCVPPFNREIDVLVDTI